MLTKNQLGFLYMFLSVCTFSIMDLLVKWSGNYPTGEVLFFRGFFGLLPTYFLIPKGKLKTFYKTVLIIGLIVFIQIVLGILTLISGAQIILASLHQICSNFLVSSSIYLIYMNYRFN